MRDYKKLWEAATAAGTEKLEENTHKGGLQIDIFYAEKRIGQENEELKKELFDLFGRHERNLEDIDVKAARLEFADILNFAAMGILECDRLIQLQKAKQCIIDGCDKKAYSRLLCKKHYEYRRKGMKNDK